MALFSSNTVHSKYKDLRTNVKAIKFAKERIEIDFDGIFHEDLIEAAEEKAKQMHKEASQNYRKSKGTIRWLLHDDEEFKLPRPDSQFAFQGEDLLHIAYDYRTVEQIAPDAFKLKGEIFEIFDLENAIYDCEYEQINLQKAIKSTEDPKKKKELYTQLEEIENLLERLEQELNKMQESRNKMIKAIKKEDAEAINQLHDLILYITPMGISLEPALRFTNLPEIKLPNTKNFFTVSTKLPTCITEVELKEAPENNDLSWAHSTLLFTLQPSVDPSTIRQYCNDKEAADKMTEAFLEGEIKKSFDGFFKSRTLSCVNDSEFQVVDYITGRVETLFVGLHGITADSSKACINDPLNPVNPEWFMNL